jgi:MYXO-CTERM domain-containing protein
MVTCDANRVCNPATGMCSLSMCGAGVSCPRGTACDPITGMCADDPCAVVRCPADHTCRAGQCRSTPNNPVTVAADRVIGSGGGCAVRPSGQTPQHVPSSTWLVAMAGLGAVLVRRRVRRSV